MGTFITSLRRNVELGHSRIGSATWEDHQNPSLFQLFFLCYSQCVSCITLQVAGWLLLFQSSHVPIRSQGEHEGPGLFSCIFIFLSYRTFYP